jgi:hypothetical protein
MPTEQDVNDFYEVDSPNHPCPVCGGKVFEWGVISRFTPMTYRRGFRFFRPDPTLGVKARHCLTCDHIQLFADEELSGEQHRAAVIVWLLAFIALVILTAAVVSTLG